MDEYGRDMDELVTVTLRRRDWWLARNQLRNMADDWERTQDFGMRNKYTDALAAQNVAQVLAAPKGDTDEGEERDE